MKKNNCPCGDNECDKKESGQGLEVKDKPFLSNREYNILHKRTHLEKWLDQYNHTMEFIRTMLAITTLSLQLIIIYRLFN